MQTGFTGFVDRSEWRWVVSVSISFMVLTLIPYLIVTLFATTPQQNRFMGVLHDHMDAAASMTRMQQGANGQSLVDFSYSAQEQTPTLMQPIYSLLGRLIAFTQLSVVTLFHVMRVFIGLYMFITIYYLGASIWVKERPRRIFFIVTSLGAGFGWILAPIVTGETAPVLPDLTLPQAFPLYASAANLHYPLAISCVAVIVAIMIAVLRPGEQSNPTAENGGAIVFTASLILAFIYPDALLPLGLAYMMNTGINWYQKQAISREEWYWGLWILVPALPVVTYNLITVLDNPHIFNWLVQRGSNVPSPLFLLASTGIPLLIAIPGIWRAIRRFEPDGDRLMLLWLVTMVICTYLPLYLNQYLLLGLMIPIGYFATRAAEDYWFNTIRRMYRPRVYLIILPVMILSHIVWLFFPVYPVIAGWTGINAIVLERDYTDAMTWLDSRTTENSVVLASADMSLWIPVWTNARVVYAHPAETINADETRAAVANWYRETGVSTCENLLDKYDVDFVIYGAREARIGSGDCTTQLTSVATFGRVTIYTR